MADPLISGHNYGNLLHDIRLSTCSEEQLSHLDRLEGYNGRMVIPMNQRPVPRSLWLGFAVVWMGLLVVFNSIAQEARADSTDSDIAQNKPYYRPPSPTDLFGNTPKPSPDTRRAILANPPARGTLDSSPTRRYILTNPPARAPVAPRRKASKSPRRPARRTPPATVEASESAEVATPSTDAAEPIAAAGPPPVASLTAETTESLVAPDTDSSSEPSPATGSSVTTADGELSLAIQAEPQNTHSGELVTFSATGIPEDRSGEYRFDFGDGTVTVWWGGNTATHSFSDAGSYEAFVEVRGVADEVQKSAPVALRIAPPGTALPVEAPTAAPAPAETAAAETTAAGAAAAEVAAAEAATVETAAVEAAAVEAATVETAAVETATADPLESLLTAESLAPTDGLGVGLSIEIEPRSAHAGEPVTFVASGIPDQGMEYRFDFGDGVASDWSDQYATTNIFSEAGSYMAFVEARGGDNQVLQSELQMVTIAAPGTELEAAAEATTAMPDVPPVSGSPVADLAAEDPSAATSSSGGLLWVVAAGVVLLFAVIGVVLVRRDKSTPDESEQKPAPQSRKRRKRI